MIIFDLGKSPPLGVPAGPVAQWESVRFTRGRSLVRSQPGPPQNRVCPKCLVNQTTEDMLTGQQRAVIAGIQAEPESLMLTPEEAAAYE